MNDTEVNYAELVRQRREARLAEEQRLREEAAKSYIPVDKIYDGNRLIYNTFKTFEGHELERSHFTGYDWPEDKPTLTLEVTCMTGHKGWPSYYCVLGHRNPCSDSMNRSHMYKKGVTVFQPVLAGAMVEGQYHLVDMNEAFGNVKYEAVHDTFKEFMEDVVERLAAR